MKIIPQVEVPKVVINSDIMNKLEVYNNLAKKTGKSFFVCGDVWYEKGSNEMFMIDVCVIEQKQSNYCSMTSITKNIYEKEFFRTFSLDLEKSDEDKFECVRNVIGYIDGSKGSNDNFSNYQIKDMIKNTKIDTSISGNGTLISIYYNKSVVVNCYDALSGMFYEDIDYEVLYDGKFNIEEAEREVSNCIIKNSSSYGYSYSYGSSDDEYYGRFTGNTYTYNPKNSSNVSVKPRVKSKLVTESPDIFSIV